MDIPSKYRNRPLSIDDLHDDCLASVFRLLSTADRNRCSLVCRRWWRVDGNTRHSLPLTAETRLSRLIPSLFLRFNSVTQLTLRRFGHKSPTITSETLTRISQVCPNLTSLKIYAACYINVRGLESIAGNCNGSKKFSLISYILGCLGMQPFVHHCKAVEGISLDSFRESEDEWTVAAPMPKLEVISLNDTVFLYPFLGAKNLRVLKLSRCTGDWDKLFPLLVKEVTGIVELHLDSLEISDIGLEAIAKCSNLEMVHLVRLPKCTDAGLVAVAKGCNKSLRKLHVGWEMEKIGDRGLMGVAEYCVNIQELVLIRMNPSKECFDMLVSNCKGLERLGVCGSDTFSDIHMNCIAAKCRALREVSIEGCPISHQGLSALVVNGRCPKLEIVKIWNCEGVNNREEHVHFGHRTLHVSCVLQHLRILSPILPDPFKDSTQAEDSFPYHFH